MSDAFSEIERECLQEIEAYLLKKYNGRVHYNHPGFTVKADKCVFSHKRTFKNYLFKFYDSAGNILGTYEVFEKFFDNFKSSYRGKKTGGKYYDTDLAFTVSGKGFDLNKINNAA